MAEYRLAPTAERDLDRIWHYTSKKWGVEQDKRYTDTLTEAFGELAEAPKTVPACDDIRVGYRRRHVERHMIYFRITSYGIAVIRLLHEAMNAPRHL